MCGEKRPILRLKNPPAIPPIFIVSKESDLARLSKWLKRRTFLHYVKFCDIKHHRALGLKSAGNKKMGVVVIKRPALEEQAEKIVWNSRTQ